MEVWDVYDKDRVFLNKRILSDNKEDLLREEYTMTVDCAIFNEDGEMLIQKRQNSKSTFPGMWDITCGGHAIAGETSEEAMSRITEYELGINHDFFNERPYMTIHKNKTIDDIYIITKEVDINALKLKYEEVQNVIWASKSEIFQLIEEGKFIPYSKGFIELLFLNNLERGVYDIYG